MDNNQDKGFTLVELLIVIVILGILATVTVFAVRGITDRGQTTACEADKRTAGDGNRGLLRPERVVPDGSTRICSRVPLAGPDERHHHLHRWLRRRAPPVSGLPCLSFGSSEALSEDPAFGRGLRRFRVMSDCCELVHILSHVGHVAADGLDVPARHCARRCDSGFTLVELLVVIAVLGILAVVAVLAVRGVTDLGASSACGADARTLTQAADVYMAQESVVVLPAVGTGADRHELFLVESGFIKRVSTKYDLQANGTVVATDETCSTAS